MSYSSYRIRTTVGGNDGVISVSLKQGVKTINILSLELNPEDAYDVQTSDYGVIVGRVLANKAFGIPNVKVSVFVPLSAEDEGNYTISNEYPFKSIYTKDREGVKYNLIQGSPGTFPNKNMVLDNGGTIEVFDKYWKYTVTTNESGDYMIFGVPTGSCQVHYDCDLSDIGMLSQKPYDLIERGYDANLFKSRDRFSDDDLDTSVRIISQDRTVYVYPFWGDKNANKIGITRNDIDINYEFRPSCIFLGSSITDPIGSYIGTHGQPSENSGRFASLTTSVGDIEMIRYTQEGKIEEVKDNVVGIIDGNGVWCYRIPMNLDRIGTDEYGNIVPINDTGKGIPTRARVRFRISLTESNDPSSSVYTAKLLVPNNPPIKAQRYILNSTCIPQLDLTEDEIENMYEFGENTPDTFFRDLFWGKVYSVKQYYPRFHYDNEFRSVKYYDYENRIHSGNTSWDKAVGAESYDDKMPENLRKSYDFSGYPTRFAFPMSCISSIDVIDGMNSFPYTTMYAGAEEHIGDETLSWFYFHLTDIAQDESLVDKGLHFCFENDWINGCLYFPKVMITRSGTSAYDFFGHASELGGNSYDYKNVYLSGRHSYRWYAPEKRFYIGYPRVHSYSWFFDGGDNVDWAGSTTFMTDRTSYFSRIPLLKGIVTGKKTILGETVFYYKCESTEIFAKAGTSFDGKVYTNDEYISKPLYKTDIILLGNTDDIYDSLPKLYMKLPPTTATFPPVATPKDISESGMNKHSSSKQVKYMIENRFNLTDMFCNPQEGNYSGATDGKGSVSNIDNFVGYDSESSKALFNITKDTFKGVKGDYISSDNGGDRNKLWAEFLEALMRRSSLFFGLYKSGQSPDTKVSAFLSYDIPTFVNTSRICELDVHNDNYHLSPYSGSLDRIYKYVPTNGIVDKYDISTNDSRSAFATMNHDINRYVTNHDTEYRQYVTYPLYVSGFDGRLKDYLNAQETVPLYHDADCEVPDKSYMLFRFGLDTYEDKQISPYLVWIISDKINSYCQSEMIMPINSFYFYFGLRSGFSAIDKLKEKYIGTMKEEVSVTARIKVTTNEKFYNCDDNVEVGYANVSYENLNFPITWKLYYKNFPYKDGTESVKVGKTKHDNLPIGAYRILVTDDSGKEFNSYFSILKHSPVMNVDVYKPSVDGKCYIIFKSYSSDTGQGGTIDVESISAKTSNSVGIRLKNGVDTISAEFSENYVSVLQDNIAVEFEPNTPYIDVTYNSSTFKCLTGKSRYTFDVYDNPDIVFNDIPTSKIATWKEFDEPAQYSTDEPDNVFSACTYYVWDGIQTAFPGRASARNYVFSDTDDFDYRLDAVSKMCSVVYGWGNSKVRDKSNTYYNTPVSLAPVIQYSRGAIYQRPYEDGKWGDDNPLTNCVKLRNDGGVTGKMQGLNQVPHIVGSNYPISIRKKTFLKEGISDILNVNKYMNNRTLRKTSIGAADGIYGINLYGIRNTTINLFDKPAKLVITPSISGSSAYTEDDYNIGGARNFFGVRTVDKRMDYRFVLRTPLFLPSGYGIFTRLESYPLVPGNFQIDLYGGFRLDFDDNTKRLTSYGNTKESLSTGGPTQDAKLYSETMREYDDFTGKKSSGATYTSIDSVKNVWYSRSVDIDHVRYVANDLKRLECIEFTATDCSTDFSDNTVKSGSTEEVCASYSPGILFVESSGNEYDIRYDVASASTSGYTEYTASLSGSSLTFVISPEEFWSPKSTYTDITVDGMNTNDYPDWAKISNDPLYTSGKKTKELAVYRCVPASGSSFEVKAEYQLKMTLIGDPDTYFYDKTEMICPYTVNGDENTPVDDNEMENVCKFYLDGDDVDTLSQPFERNSFLIIPTRRVYTSITENDNQQKQGIAYDNGDVYFTGSVFVKMTNDEHGQSATVRLYTPLRIGETISLSDATTLVTSDGWHTIGSVNTETMSCEGYNVVYDQNKAEFTVTKMGESSPSNAMLYFYIENGLRYLISIEF